MIRTRNLANDHGIYMNYVIYIYINYTRVMELSDQRNRTKNSGTIALATMGPHSDQGNPGNPTIGWYRTSHILYLGTIFHGSVEY